MPVQKVSGGVRLRTKRQRNYQKVNPLHKKILISFRRGRGALNM